MDNNKDFLILGNMNAITYKEVFPYIKENRIGLGYLNGNKNFITVDNKEQPIRAFWYTTLPIAKHNDKLILYKHYTPELYPKYDNYDAINVDKTCDIPADYDGVMGVPISFLNKYNPNQFEILGLDRYIKDNPHYGHRFTLNNKETYARILIKKL